MNVVNGRPRRFVGGFSFFVAIATIAAFSPRLHGQEAYGDAPRSRVEADAENGKVEAQFELGRRANSSGDDATAVKWYRKAAEGNSAAAQYNLGIMYAQGRGVEKDLSLIHI